MTPAAAGESIPAAGEENESRCSSRRVLQEQQERRNDSSDSSRSSRRPYSNRSRSRCGNRK